MAALRVIRAIITDPDWRPWFIKSDPYVARLFRRVLLIVLAAIPLIIAAAVLVFIAAFLAPASSGELIDAAYACTGAAAVGLAAEVVALCQLVRHKNRIGQ